MNPAKNRPLQNLHTLSLSLVLGLLCAAPLALADQQPHRSGPRPAARGPAQPAPQGRVQLPAPGSQGMHQNPGQSRQPGASSSGAAQTTPTAPGGGYRQAPAQSQTPTQVPTTAAPPTGGFHQLPGGNATTSQPAPATGGGFHKAPFAGGGTGAGPANVPGGINNGGNWQGGDNHTDSHLNGQRDDHWQANGGPQGNYYHHRLAPIQRVPDRDRGNWSQGHWSHGDHNGYAGWWWVLGGSWYFYDSPYYPYPSPDAPTEIISDDDSDQAPDTTYNDAPPDESQVAQAQQPETNDWYYCQNPQGYYPDVQSCNVEWTTVPATSAAPTAPAQASYWYYCQNPQGYYPTVQSCSVDWTPVSSTPATTASAAPTTYWYYCQNPAGYYPDVGMCNSDWIPVPANQPAAQAGPPGQPGDAPPPPPSQ